MKLDLVFRTYLRRPGPVSYEKLAARIVRAALPYLKLPRGSTSVELGVAITGRDRIRTLNRRWRKIDKPTDVLSFPLPAPTIAGYTAVSLGDVFVCPAMVRVKARQSGNTFQAQLEWTIVHGILHLAGYDHERGASAAERMASLERRILKDL